MLAVGNLAIDLCKLDSTVGVVGISYDNAGEDIKGEVIKEYSHIGTEDGAMDTEELIVSNMDIVDIAVYKLKVCRELSDDARSEGYLALVKAAKNFDCGRDTKFRTYAYSCVSGAIKNMISFGKSVSFPSTIVKMASSVREYLKNTSIESVYNLTDMDWEELGVHDTYTKMAIADFFSESVSIDATISGDDGDEYGIEIADTSVCVDESVIESESISSICEYIDLKYGTNSSKSKVIKYIVMSIMDGRNETLSEIGNRFGIKKQTVTVYMKALKKDEELRSILKASLI